MAKLTVVVCDTCEDRDRPTKSYRIVSEGRTKELDLCEEHGAPIEQFMEGTKSRGGRRAGSGRASSRMLTDPADAPKASDQVKASGKKEPANA